MTKLEFRFLAHFKAGERQRVAMTRGFTDIPEGDPRHLKLVLDDGIPADRRPSRRGEGLGQAFMYGGDFWALPEAINDCFRRPFNDETYHADVGQKGLKNFAPPQQARFAFEAFGLTMLERTPDGFCFNSSQYDLKSYKMTVNRKGHIFWDDTDRIEQRVARYFQQNAMVVDGTVFCRIERPCFDITAVRDRSGARLPPRRIFTPHGGYGDKVMDFQKASIVADDYRHRVSWSTERERVGEIVFDLPEDDTQDHLARRMRAVFMTLFRYGSWINSQEDNTRAKHSKKLSALYDIWLSKKHALDEDTLDDMAELILPMTDEGNIRNAVTAWIDRPVFAGF